MIRDHDLFPLGDSVKQLFEPILRFAYANLHGYVSIGRLLFIVQRLHAQKSCGAA
jgi:hypothetical protein